MTKLVSGTGAGQERRIRDVRTRGGNTKRRALRLDSGNFSWGSEGTCLSCFACYWVLFAASCVCVVYMQLGALGDAQCAHYCYPVLPCPALPLCVYVVSAAVATRKTRILDVVYNASNNELVRTKTLVKNCIVAVRVLWVASCCCCSAASSTATYNAQL